MEEIIIKQEAGSITANFDEVKAYLNGQLEVYRNMVFTEDSIKEGKDTIANLRKEKKALSDRLKDVKKAYLVPLDNFMEKANELVDMFDAPICFINEQLEEYEAKRVEEKRQLVVAMYDELVPEEDIREIIPFAKIYDSHWMNKTYSEKDITADILTKKQGVKDALATLSAMTSEALPKAIENYKQTLDLASSINIITSYENQRREILAREEEKKKREEEERIRREERERIEAERRAEEEKAKAVAEAKEEAHEEVMSMLMPKEEAEEEEKVYVYNIFLTDSSKEALETYMNSVGITFAQRDLR